MHAVKVERHDTAARMHHTNTGDRPVDVYQEHPHGLFVARPFTQHPRIAYWQAHLLPALGVQVCRYTLHAGRPFDYYIDIARITRSGAVWELRDHYLDVLVWGGLRAEIVDTDELVASVHAGLIEQGEALQAVESLHRVLNGLARHHYDVNAWLAESGVTLEWPDVPRPALLARG